MSRLRVHCFGVSLDGYGAGPSQDLQHPLGRPVMVVHPHVACVQNLDGGERGVRQPHRRTFEARGSWAQHGPSAGVADFDWKGWWGDEPVYHCRCSCDTPRVDQGGATFTSCRNPRRSNARAAANGKDAPWWRRGDVRESAREAGRRPALRRAAGCSERRNLFRDLDLDALGTRSTRRSPAAGDARVRAPARLVQVLCVRLQLTEPQVPEEAQAEASPAAQAEERKSKYHGHGTEA
jgi:hypothetical protein